MALRRLRDRRLERRGLLGEPGQRVALGLDPLAQILDLALGLEDAARLVAGCRRTPDAGRGTDRPPSVATGSARRAAGVGRARRTNRQSRRRRSPGESRRQTDRSRGRPTTARPSPRAAAVAAVRPSVAGGAVAVRRRTGVRRRSGIRSGPRRCSRTSSKPAAACSGRSTMTCCRRSPRQASTARS